MSFRFRITSWMLAAALGGGLAGGAAAGQAAADTFTYNQGAEQYYTVPAGVHGLLITATGGGGGDGLAVSGTGYGFGGDYPTPGGVGGPGAIVSADVAVNPGDQLGIEVGTQGDSGSGDSAGGQSSGSGANGGAGGPGAGGGGGATVITNQTSGTTLLAAGGGGGGGAAEGNTVGAGGAGGVAGPTGSASSNGGAGQPGGAGGPAAVGQQSAGGNGENGNPGDGQGGVDGSSGGGGGGLFDLAIGATSGGGAGGSIAPGGGGGGGGGGSYLSPLDVAYSITSDSTAENGSAMISTTGLRVAVAAGANPNPAYIGSNVRLTAGVQSNIPGDTPTGTVDFSLPNPDGSGATIDLGTAPVTSNGGASLTVPVSALGTDGATGSYTITAVYTSDSSTFADAQGTTTVNIHKLVAANLTLAANPNSATAGQGVTFTATVNPPAGDPTATGTVTFQTGSGSNAITQTASLNASGIATWTSNSLPAGADTVNATYGGDGNYLPEQASVTEQIQPQLVKPSLYVADYGSNAISIYSSGASGRTLLGTISGSQTGLDYPEGVAVDSLGDLFVANALGNTITEYAPGASGNVAPIATISGSRTALNDPRFLALDSSDDLWVVDAASNSITEYTPGSNGNVGPSSTISGSATGIDNPIGIAFDPFGELDVSNAGDNTVTTYQPGANGNATPVATLQGANTGLNGPKGLSFNSLDQLIVANDSGGVSTYMLALSANEAPLTTLTGTSNSLANAEQAIIDPSNNTLVVDSLTQGTLDAWPAGTTGATAPTSSIQIGAGSQPTQITLDPLNP